MEPSAPIFTAAAIAACLDRSPQAIRKALCDVKPAGVLVVYGKEAAAWPLSALPAGVRCQLDAVALQRRYRDTAAMLANPPKQWDPALPLHQIADSEIDRANKLRAALMPSLMRQHDGMTSAELEAAGQSEYTKFFGHVVSARHWRSLFMRTLKRDGGAENWNRLELYLADNPTPKSAPVRPLPPGSADQFQELSGYIAACSNPQAPTEIEQRGVWTLAFEQHKILVNQGKTETKAARIMRDFLFAAAPFLVNSRGDQRNALRMAFERKLAAWQARGAAALCDGRENNGNSFELPEDDRDLLIGCAVTGWFGCKGDVAPAWRCLIRGEKAPVKNAKTGLVTMTGFTSTVMERYAGRAKSKSHVPASVMESIRQEVEILTVMHQGPRALDAIKGHVTRSYDGISSLQCISGDDFTMNTYFYVPDGKGWFELTRGQVILFIDFRTSRILGWALEPRKSYSSLTIRSLCTHVFGEFGLPEVLYFERGLWKSATLLKGKTDPFTFTEISQGLREFGITFKHAIRPRTKTVERIGGMFQDLAEAEPGYCGRDERRDAPESLRPQMAEVLTENKERRVHPSKYFYSLDQWNDRIGQLVEKYNSEVQQGHMLDGLSPDEAFKKHTNWNNPPMQFNAALRYKLAHDKRRVVVTLNGVTIQIGKKKFNYLGDDGELKHLVNREALAWFDPENPETIVVTTLDQTDPICVSLSKNPSALQSLIAPDSGILEHELARISRQASYMKTRFNIVKAKFELPQRKLLAAAQVVELGEEIAAQKTALTEKAARRQHQRGKANRITQRTGIVVPERAQENIQAEDASILADFLNDDTTPQPESLTQSGGKFIYHLKPGGNKKGNQ